MKELMDKLGSVKASVLDGLEMAFDAAAKEAKLSYEADLKKIEAAKNKAMGRVGVDFGGVLQEVEIDLTGGESLKVPVENDVPGVVVVPEVYEVKKAEFLKVGHAEEG